ncbi:DUF5689 domain-containing protein [Hufsiella ginkgonis]|uniref:DUF5689 domain-containing protein n=1 Tax=Hufsiella ginkgonis TaxID=2695274 RepID=A0A7K1XZV5_9SPHI|nr:DUF5689 domain-containing protein [Hufsiella ginkgonis]MXV16472.1 hypothetical protein [Hufsiella ginkgonis]
MKTILLNFVLLLTVAIAWSGCEQDDKNPYDGGIVSPYVFTFDLRKVYKQADVVLTTTNMSGATSIQGIVVSDHAAKNMLNGLMMVQNSRNASSGDSLRGIALNVGAAAANYMVGDLVRVKVEGRTLTRRNGILQVIDIPATDIVKVSSGNTILGNRVTTAALLADPRRYESTQVTIIKATYNPSLLATDVFSGDKLLNDGFGNITLHTEAGAAFAGAKPPFSANYTGLVVTTEGANGALVPQIRIRNNTTDLKTLSSNTEQPAIIITGFMSDVKGGDGNYEYIQFRATRAINFAAEPFSVVTTNNAGTNPAPATGWAIGGVRSYKLDLTSGSVVKGEFFYVGGSRKLINGATSTTSMASSKWIRSFDYSTIDGDGFGTKTSGLLANSGNASGIAVFKGTAVNVSSVPVDVVFIGTGGGLFSAGPPAAGYRVTSTDVYDAVEPVTGVDQPFYRQGTNTAAFIYLTADLGYFNQLGGTYDTVLGKWTKIRTQVGLLLTTSSPVSDIEGAGSTEIK